MSPRQRSGVPLLVLAGIGIAISVYLTITKLVGAAPICGPSGGCESVEASTYSSVAGIPLALIGVGFSAMVAVATFRWWRRADRRALVAAYALGLAGSVVEAYLVYLELLVIHAICIWCVAYGFTVVLGFLGAIFALRSGYGDRGLDDGPG